MVLRPFQLEIVFASWLSVVEYRAVDVSFKWKALRISIRTVTLDAALGLRPAKEKSYTPPSQPSLSPTTD